MKRILQLKVPGYKRFENHWDREYSMLVCEKQIARLMAFSLFNLM